MTDLTRDEILKDTILPMAERDHGFAIDIDDMDACAAMVENGILTEVFEMPEDGERKKGRKTPFVILLGELK